MSQNTDFVEEEINVTQAPLLAASKFIGMLIYVISIQTLKQQLCY